MLKKCFTSLLAAPLGFHAGLASGGTRASLDVLIARKCICSHSVMLPLHQLVSTLQATFLSLFRDRTTAGHLAKSSILKFSVDQLQVSCRGWQCGTIGARRGRRKVNEQWGDIQQREGCSHHHKRPAREVDLPCCTAALSTEFASCAFARIVRTLVPHHESCLPLLHEPHLIMPESGGAGGR